MDRELTNMEKIQAVINTLELLDMPATFDNCNKMTGIYNTLAQVRDDLAVKEAVKDGTADAE